MMRFATYMIGVVLLVVAVWLVLTTLDVIAVLPATIIAAILLFVLGLGVIGASRRAPREPRQTETTVQKTGDTEVRRSRVH